jgi:hypothetical protein
MILLELLWVTQVVVVDMVLMVDLVDTQLAAVAMAAAAQVADLPVVQIQAAVEVVETAVLVQADPAL